MTINPDERPLEQPTDERMADPTEADTIRRQDSAAEGWYSAPPFRPRP
jgi:hypothetical protein